MRDEAYPYDANGNLTSDGAFTYAWDEAGRLMDATAADHSVKLHFAYDSQGRRIEKDVFSWNSATSSWSTAPSQATAYAYDGWNLIAEFDILDGNRLTKAYTWSPQSAGGIGGLLAITDYSDPVHPQTYTPFYDGSGNVTGLLDASGNIVATYTYTAFGQMTATWSGPTRHHRPQPLPLLDEVL